MRSYGQFCALARALDAIGDRWSLLIVRELWLRPHRFGTLAQALPGAATNMLTDRLRALEAAGVVARTAPTPAVYCLTERGEALVPVMQELIRWGEAEMERAPGDDVCRNDWFAQAVETLIPTAAVTHPLVFGIDVNGGGPAAVLVAEPGKGVRAARGDGAETPRPLACITGDAATLVAVIGGRTDLAALEITGTATAAKRLRAMLARAHRIKDSQREDAGRPLGV